MLIAGDGARTKSDEPHGRFDPAGCACLDAVHDRQQCVEDARRPLLGAAQPPAPHRQAQHSEEGEQRPLVIRDALDFEPGTVHDVLEPPARVAAQVPGVGVAEAPEPVVRRHGYEHPAARPDDAACLRKRGRVVRVLQQIQQQDAVEAAVHEGKRVGVAPVERGRRNEIRRMLERSGRGVDPARVVTVVEQPARGRPRPAADVEDALRLAQLVPQQYLDQTPAPAEPEMRLLQGSQLLGSPGSEAHARTGALPVNLRLPSHRPTLTGGEAPIGWGARAVESGGFLENRWACKRPVGSNPTPAVS